MSLRLPESTEECLYFTNRGHIIAWVYRKECPRCHKARMGKPVDARGKVKIRAKEYQCPHCKHTEDQETYEASVKIEAVYTCPKCKKKGESIAEYQRKNYQGIPSYMVICQHCGEKMALTKKLRGKREEDVE